MDIQRRVAPLVYMGGYLSKIYYVDLARFSIIEIEEIAKEVGCKVFTKCWYKVPSLPLCGGLRILEKDSDIRDMVEWVPAYRVLEVYLEYAECDETVGRETRGVETGGGGDEVDDDETEEE